MYMYYIYIYIYCTIKNIKTQYKTIFEIKIWIIQVNGLHLSKAHRKYDFFNYVSLWGEYLIL